MKPDKSLMLKCMSFMIIGNFLFVWVLAYNIAAWQFVPGIKELGTLSNALTSAIFTWLGFYLPGQLGATVWTQGNDAIFSVLKNVVG